VTWEEIAFRYAPGTADRSPRRVAPHQPRLDWQMWFAALGSYENNPWLVHLMYKILEESEDVLELLEMDLWPWRRGEQRLRSVRASLYHYDFTRWDTPWARSVPGAALLKQSPTGNSSGGHMVGPWWSRTYVREYVPAVTDAELAAAVQRQGWPYGKAQREAAAARAKDCGPARSAGPLTGAWCIAVQRARATARTVTARSGWVLPTTLQGSAVDHIFLDANFAAITLGILPFVAAAASRASVWHICYASLLFPGPSTIIVAALLALRCLSRVCGRRHYRSAPHTRQRRE